MRDRQSSTPRRASLPPVPRDIEVELTSDIRRDSLGPVIAAGNDAFERIKTHRKQFRRDWVPLIDCIYILSRHAWEATGRRMRLDGRPDWTYDPIQREFRKLSRDLPWGGFIQERRDLLSVVRHIGDERERFLAWYDHPGREEMRERVGHPVTLWKKFASEVLKPAEHNNCERAEHHDDERAEHDNDHNNEGDEEVEARTDAERMAHLVAANEACRGFCLRLRASVNEGRSTLEAGLREELDRLLEAEDVA